MHLLRNVFALERVNFTARFIWIAAAVVVLAGCQPADQGNESPPAEAAESAAPAEAAPRAFFANVEDGATVPQIYEYQFAVENFEIQPVGDGMVREGKGHFHIGIDTICLPADTVIPTADPWIHFGDGSAAIELDLAPGPHTLVLQIGDGEHRTLDEAGLCAVISVEVEG